jgi:spore coat protein U-like protein
MANKGNGCHLFPVPVTRKYELLGISVTITIFGSIPARQNASVGSYTDSVTVTINF